MTIQENECCRILVLVVIVRFLIKDKSENTFIKYVILEGIPTSITKLIKVLQITIRNHKLVCNEQKNLPSRKFFEEVVAYRLL